jgi:allophanate hydrolase
VDLHAHCWANRLVGNPVTTNSLEITVGNVILQADFDMTLSLCGAEFFASIEGKPVNNWQAFVLRKGQTLKLGFARHGFRGYLAVKGGFDVPTVFGSAATVVRNGLGGLPNRPGSALHCEDVLPVNEIAQQNDQRLPSMPRYFIPQYRKDISLTVLEGYQAEQFTLAAKQAFYAKPYLVTDKLDRMGIRLQGEAVECGMNGVISEGIALGAIQFPANGQPIILLNDRQTLGGYPKIGCVSRMSLMALAQARPGTRLHFHRGEMALESNAYQTFLRFFASN